MIKVRTVTIGTALALGVGLSAVADSGKGTPNGAAGHGPVLAQAAHCPPGLAKKNPPCVPPGQVGKARYRVGDRITGDYILIRDPGRYRLDPNQTYYRVGDYVYRVDRDTRKVLDFLGAAAALLN